MVVPSTPRKRVVSFLALSLLLQVAKSHFGGGGARIDEGVRTALSGRQCRTLELCTFGTWCCFKLTLSWVVPWLEFSPTQLMEVAHLWLSWSGWIHLFTSWFIVISFPHHSLSFFFFLLKNILFVYLALGLSCSTLIFHCSVWALELCYVSYFPDQGSNPIFLHWKADS